MDIAPLSGNATNWVVVADQAEAMVYSRKGRRGPLETLFSLQNSVAGEKVADLISDRGGRSFDSHGQGRHTMAREKSGPKRHASEAFAKQIAERLKRARQEGSYRELTLIAAPRFLGDLKKAIAREGGVEPTLTIDKEMVGQDAKAIEKLLDSY
jgi:protein required for attachment to host cells